ncbi:MAG: hypothetical protein K0S56_3510 [Microvirga sp.]|jgi:hypothetical protein|nr:hypothetical protein [Microvirga sp.]
MLRAFFLALTLAFAGPVAATGDVSDNPVLAQQKPAPPTPKRDCEKSAEGIS